MDGKGDAKNWSTVLGANAQGVWGLVTIVSEEFGGEQASGDPKLRKETFSRRRAKNLGVANCHF